MNAVFPTKIGRRNVQRGCGREWIGEARTLDVSVARALQDLVLAPQSAGRLPTDTGNKQ